MVDIIDLSGFLKSSDFSYIKALNVDLTVSGIGSKLVENKMRHFGMENINV